MTSFGYMVGRVRLMPATAAVLVGCVLVVIPAGHAATPKAIVVPDTGLIVVDGSKVGNTEIECLVSGGAVWCGIAKIGNVRAQPNTCGVVIDDVQAVIFCRKGSAVPAQFARRGQPTTRGPICTGPNQAKPLYPLSSGGGVLAIAGSHIVCYSPKDLRGSVICLPSLTGPFKPVWFVQMTRTQVGLRHLLRSGPIESAPIVVVRSTRFQ